MKLPDDGAAGGVTDQGLGYLLPENPLEHNSDLICTKCKRAVKAVNVAAMSRGLEDAIDDINDNYDSSSDEMEKEIVRFSRILHPKHYLMLRLKKRLIDVLESEEDPADEVSLRYIHVQGAAKTPTLSQDPLTDLRRNQWHLCTVVG